MSKNIVVVGNGMVGHRFVESLAELAPQAHITVFGAEPRFAYDRVQLSAYFNGKSADDLALTDAHIYQYLGVTAILDDKVVDIDRSNKTVRSASGKTVSYDKLILATGSYPFVPPISGRERENCFVYRTIEDLEAIQQAARSAKTGVVVGGGLLGLEAANALKSLGLETHVVEFAPRLMAVQLDDNGGAQLRRKIEDLGVKVHTEKNTQLIEDGDSALHQMVFADGSVLETDMIVFSAGIRPQDELAKQAELALGERGGIAINDFCQTSDPDVYAIGECALWNQQIFGLVAPGYQMAKVAAKHLLDPDTDASFTGADMSTKLKLLGVDVASIGDAHARTPGAQSYTYWDEATEIYKKLVVSDCGKRLLGAVLVGDTESYGTLLQLSQSDSDLPVSPEQLILSHLEDIGGSDAALGVGALPDTAQICSCHDVSKADLVAAIDQGATELSQLKACTKAGTGCGGCSTLVGQVLNSELAARGVEVNDHLCEHFEYSRVELAEIIRVKQIKSFKELLHSHGNPQSNSDGCEICKPAVGSILASTYNDYVLSDQHLGLQDTNDVFLGNMQKDGTYSVVPRVPAGEILPDQLIALGQVAKEFDLYTKITGGQRVDLFGAQLHELPQIWAKLIDAGFETGHAYAKSLRTVKSCVGSTWCRYGVDDSVGLAVRIENRYKGLRAPHKIKMAVSGCTRECAEAQSKDIGVIATENGWNLYVCGNGGMRPRHADLFASDLDEETLIRYIDRVLMLYVRTADKLTRTSVWLENLDGGIDHLRDVVINDSLGVATELEQQMANVIATYQCEWKTTLSDEQKLKRFSHFINEKLADPSLAYVYERNQRRPVGPADSKAVGSDSADESIAIVEVV